MEDCLCGSFSAHFCVKFTLFAPVRIKRHVFFLPFLSESQSLRSGQRSPNIFLDPDEWTPQILPRPAGQGTPCSSQVPSPPQFSIGQPGGIHRYDHPSPGPHAWKSASLAIPLIIPRQDTSSHKLNYSLLKAPSPPAR